MMRSSPFLSHRHVCYCCHRSTPPGTCPSAPACHHHHRGSSRTDPAPLALCRRPTCCPLGGQLDPHAVRLISKKTVLGASTCSGAKGLSRAHQRPSQHRSTPPPAGLHHEPSAVSTPRPLLTCGLGAPPNCLAGRVFSLSSQAWGWHAGEQGRSQYL